MTRRALVLLIALICFAGCTMIPKYSRPVQPVPAGWPQGPAYAPEGSPAAAGAGDVIWRDFYADAKLRELIAIALKNNRDLRVAVLNIEVARGQYRIQRAQLFPAVNAVGDEIRERVPADLSVTRKSIIASQYDMNLGFSAWEIDFFGRIASLKAAALEQYLSTEAAARSAQISLMAQVASAYLLIGADRDDLRLARSTFASREAEFNLVSRRFEVGTASLLDVRQAQTAMEAARADVSGYTRAVALDVNALSLLLGAQAPADLLPEGLDAVTPPKEISAGLSSDVLLRRPDILAAESQLKSANANIGAARAAFFPRITLSAAGGTSSSQLSGLFQPGSAAWSFVPQIVAPIFDAGARIASLRVAEANRAIFVAQYEKAIQIAFREVADALAGRGTIGSQMASQKALVDATAETYRLSNARYMRGIDNYLAVLDAQRSLYSAQQGLITLRLADLNYLVMLYKVLGGGGM